MRKRKQHLFFAPIVCVFSFSIGYYVPGCAIPAVANRKPVEDAMRQSAQAAADQTKDDKISPGKLGLYSQTRIATEPSVNREQVRSLPSGIKYPPDLDKTQFPPLPPGVKLPPGALDMLMRLKNNAGQGVFRNNKGLMPLPIPDRRVEPNATQANQGHRIEQHTLKKKFDKIPDLNNWRHISYLADNLIDDNKFDRAEILLTSILPRAKKEVPRSLDYALTLCRLGTALYALKKYPPALLKLQEAIEILSHNPAGARQRSIMWRSMATKAAVLLRLQKNVEAETLARKSIAYAIAFPDIATPKQLKITYTLLSNSLQGQNKIEEANKITEIMNQQ